MEAHGTKENAGKHCFDWKDHQMNTQGNDMIYFANDLTKNASHTIRRRHSNTFTDNITVSDLFLQKDSSTRSQLSSSSSPSSQQKNLPKIKPLHSLGSLRN